MLRRRFFLYSLLMGITAVAPCMTLNAQQAPLSQEQILQREKEILRKPIPDRLVVFTFDDGCASAATVAAPVLKEAGFNASFYISDFGSFKTRKDWYLTWEQIRQLQKDGFDVGNHTMGHVVMARQPVDVCQKCMSEMEAEFAANGVAKPITLAWPVYDANRKFFPWLQENGYKFGRGGYHRPYRPALDHPLDVPCMEGFDLKKLIDSAKMAKDGNVIVFTFHGVPDHEHPWVNLDPDVFRQFVKYLKDNQYTVISLLDMAEYIDVDKAMKMN